MIVPWLKGFLNWHQAPLTWTLIVLNFFVFCLTFESTRFSGAKDFSNVNAMVLTGRLYYQFNNPQQEKLPLLSTSQWMVMGSAGLKDGPFLEKAPFRDFYGDQIKIREWKKMTLDYHHQISERNSQLFGLHSVNSTSLSWITYQFMHAGWMHLIGNMLMLLLFGAALEQAVGGLALVCIYLLSGMAGAGMFILLSQNSLAPMIGASGSLSGVMAFYAAYEKKKRVSFFYLVSPMQGYYGWIYLPTLMLFPLCFLSDFAGYLGTPAEIGAGIAFTAHIGGSLFGAFGGLACRSFRQSLWWQWLCHH